MAICLLDAHTAELIAAGEVVERPASVVKELVENAIDAGASFLTVEIERGGIALMRIDDDGTGIEKSDVELAFMRHATSKVKNKEDLDNILTLGFRGEALCSIASVAKIQLVTKSEKDQCATLFTAKGGSFGPLQDAARPRGTTISVMDLFYNVPARMKFLKKDTSEGLFVTETLTRLALSHPKIAFKYIREGRQVFFAPGKGDLRAAAYAVLGADFAKELLQVQGQDGQYKVTGLISPPKAVRASRTMQHFYVNGRFVKNSTIMAALEQAYRGTIMQGKYPGCVLFLQMPPSLVDVNVHPAKTQVRFAKEQDVFAAVYRAVKSALVQGQQNFSQIILPTAQKNAQQSQMQSSQNMPSTKGQSALTGGEMPKENLPHAVMESSFGAMEYRRSAPVLPPPKMPAQEGKTFFYPDIEGPKEEDPPFLPPIFVADAQVQTQQTQQTQLVMQEHTEGILVLGELFKTYIVAQWKTSMCLIDKHAAHERIIYEELAQTQPENAAQQLLLPISVQLSAGEKAAVLQNQAALKQVGIDAEDFGAGSVLLRAVPINLEEAEAENLLIEIAQRLSVNSMDMQNSKSQWLMHSIACRAALKANDKTHKPQMLALAEKILTGKVPPFCPHGRPVVLEISRKELEKQFGRLG